MAEQGVLTVLAADDFQPLFFLLPDSIGLLEYLLIVELAWLVAMAIYGSALRKIVRNPRDSVVVFHRIFWRIFVYPKKTSLLEAYETPMSVAGLDDFDTPLLDVPSYENWSGDPVPQDIRDPNADTAGGSAMGARAQVLPAGGMMGLDADVDLLADDVAPPPEPAPLSAGEAGEIEINVELQANAQKLAVAGMIGDTLSVHVPCGAEEGIANRHVVHALCHVLNLESYQVTLLRGHARGQKTFRLTGISLQNVQQRVMAVSQ